MPSGKRGSSPNPLLRIRAKSTAPPTQRNLTAHFFRIHRHLAELLHDFMGRRQIITSDKSAACGPSAFLPTFFYCALLNITGKVLPRLLHPINDAFGF